MEHIKKNNAIQTQAFSFSIATFYKGSFQVNGMQQCFGVLPIAFIPQAFVEHLFSLGLELDTGVTAMA